MSMAKRGSHTRNSKRIRFLPRYPNLFKYSQWRRTVLNFRAFGTGSKVRLKQENRSKFLALSILMKWDNGESNAPYYHSHVAHQFLAFYKRYPALRTPEYSTAPLDTNGSPERRNNVARAGLQLIIYTRAHLLGFRSQTLSLAFNVQLGNMRIFFGMNL